MGAASGTQGRAHVAAAVEEARHCLQRGRRYRPQQARHRCPAQQKKQRRSVQAQQEMWAVPSGATQAGQ
ncbi:UNVERIFIED_CONTAM: hypothetical protein K2H54_064484 [Gekko kuhli]